MYVTVRTVWNDSFYVNTINDDGTHSGLGRHEYKHKRSARRAAKALAARRDIAYRQDLEYTSIPSKVETVVSSN